MILKDLPYNFHDSIIISCKMEKADRLKLAVELYSIYYPSEDNLQLTFSGIINFREVKEWVEKLNDNVQDPNWVGSGIDDLEYNPNYTSKELDQQLVLEVDGCDKLNIHCKKLRISKLGE